MSDRQVAVDDGEDLRGRSALLLLASPRAGARALFLLSQSEAIVNTSPLPAARFLRVVVNASAALPFGDHAFDCVIVDGDQVPLRSRNIESSRNLAREVGRVVRPDGQCVVVARHNRVPARRVAIGRYLLALPGNSWKQALTTDAFGATDLAAVGMNGRRITELAMMGPGTAAAAGSQRMDFRATVFTRAPGRAVSLLERVLSEIAATTTDDSGGSIDRLLVRKIGKTAVMASCGGRRVLVKVPRTPVAQRRAGRNFDALQRLHLSDAITPDNRAIIPRAIRHGCIGDYAYYAEEMLDGRELTESALQSSSWQPDAVQFITGLHVRTRQERVVDDACFEARFAAPVRRIQDACHLEDTATARAFDGIVAAMREVVGQPMPFVWAHGDFALTNCLYDTAGRLSAVVDWELFSPEGLPLLDILQCMPIAGESNGRPRWQRFDVIASLLRQGIPRDEGSELGKYLSRVGISDRVVPPLLLMYWVDHVANRIQSRRADPVWMRKRVLQPLAVLKQQVAP
jgi:SAM-dependent methyltransferase